ncbi:tetratricopeptide repeat protein [Nonomuraea spiralis]|uniref:tetratricopeptide repeat protein n=1 Tax=Nonomuraea spiralis TaxID=46182 RepID=UPI00378D67EF
MTEPPVAAQTQVNAPRAGGVVNAVQDGVLNVHQWKPAYRLEDFPAAPRPVQAARVRRQPSLLLRAGYRAVPFSGREDDLRRLSAWRDGDEGPGLGVRLLHGPGGQGKTRLAARFAELSRAAGWQVWQATANAPGTAEAQATADAQVPADGPGVLVVVDYAERWPVPALYELLQEPALRTGRVRVLLLARPAGVWWDSIAAWIDRVLDTDADAQPLSPLVAGPDLRQRLFADARDHFATHLGLPPGQAATIAPPAGLADDEAYAQVLTVHIAALAAVDALRHGEEEPAGPARASAYLLRREREHWAELHRRTPEPLASDPTALGRAVFTATFTRPLARPHARAVLRLAALAETVEQANTLLDDHGYCYPPAQPGTVLEPLYPDRLAEDFAALSLPGAEPAVLQLDDWAGHALAGLLAVPAGPAGEQGQAPPWVRPALTMLIETARRWPHVAATQLYPLLAARPELMLHAGGAALARLANLPGVDPDLLGHVEDHLPAGRHIDLDIGMAALSTRLTGHYLAATTYPAAHAALHVNHAIRLVHAGQHHAALESCQRAVDLYRRLSEHDEEDRRPELAGALNNLANLLSTVGRRAEALPISEHAVRLYGDLAAHDRDTYLPDLAMSLTNHSARLAETGRLDEALPVSEQAVQLYDELAAHDRDAYLPDLAMSLNNHVNRLGAAWRLDEALLISEQAVRLYDELAARDREAHLPDLASSLDNRATVLAEAGRVAEALPISERALQLRRHLAGVNQDAYLPALAMSLNNHALLLADLGRPAEALPMSEQAVRLCGELAERDRVARLPDLAMALTNHAMRLTEAGRLLDALPYSEQAALAYGELAELDREAVLPGLARSLSTHAARLAEAGRRDEALPVAELGIGLYDELIEADRYAHLPALATSLDNYATLLTETGRPRDALPVTERAVLLHGELAELNPDVYMPDRVRSLGIRGWALTRAHRYGEAVVPLVEALTAWEEPPGFAHDLLATVVDLLRTAHRAGPDEVDTVFEALTGDTLTEWLGP